MTTKRFYPLSDRAFAELHLIARRPEPYSAVMKWVAQKLLRDNLSEIVMLPSPYPADHGREIAHLKVTAAGLQKLETEDDG